MTFGPWKSSLTKLKPENSSPRKLPKMNLASAPGGVSATFKRLK